MRFETERLVLRWARCDKDTILQEIDWLNDPEVTRYSEQRHKRHTFGSQYDYIRSFFCTQNMLFEIWIKAPGDGIFIGTLSVYYDAPNKTADMGIMIGDKLRWGSGYGIEAWNAAIQYVFDTSMAMQVTAGCMVTNRPMIKIMERSGMRPRGEIKNRFLQDGVWRNAVYYGRSR